MPATVEESFGSCDVEENEPAVERGDDEDLRKYNKGKTFRTKCFCAERDRRKSACMMLFETPPLDHLWRVLQHADDSGGSLKSPVNEETNPFVIASRG